LLSILLAEERDVRAHDVEQLQTDGRHTAKVIRSRRTFSAGFLDLDPGAESLRVHALGARDEEHVHAGFLREPRVTLLVTWVTLQVVVRAELCGIPEPPDDDEVA